MTLEYRAYHIERAKLLSALINRARRFHLTSADNTKGLPFDEDAAYDDLAELTNEELREILTNQDEV